jgi:diguanylate cyclase (GGDEF)-like protein
MTTIHKLLERQIRKSISADGGFDFDMLFALISAAYNESEQEQRRTDRSIGLMVAELEAVNAGLEAEVAGRTHELRDVRARLEQTLASVDQGIIMISAAGRVVVYNEAFLSFTGLTSEDCAHERPFSEVIALMHAKGEFSRMDARFIEWVNAGADAPPMRHFQRVRQDGTVLDVRCRSLPGGGEVRTLTDITSLVRQTQQAEAVRHTLQATLDNLSQGVIKVDAARNVEFFNPRVEELLSLPNGFLKRGMPFREILDWQIETNEFAKSDPSFVSFVRSGGILDAAQAYERERPNGLILETRTIPLDDGAVVRTYTDITDSRRRERQLLHIAHFDTLTGLANRALLNERMAKELAVPGVAGSPTVLCIDLDRFKAVNDAMGHEAGDLLLQQAAERLQRLTPAGGLLARFGGDEFIMFMPDLVDAEEASQLSCAIVRELSEPFLICGKNTWVGASIGIAVAVAGDTPQDLLKKADIALYRVKSSGRGTFQLYRPAFHEEMMQRQEMEEELRRALREGEFRIFYQPIVDLRTGEPVGYEALLRWQHPHRGLLGPAAFIEVAEDSGLIAPIGELVLNEACRTFAKLDPDLFVSVNLSPIQFSNHALAATVLNAVADARLRPGRLVLEITERLLLTEDDKTALILAQLRALGVKIALDDFGIGNSSFAYLQKFCFDKIKIDRSFMADASKSGMSAAIRRSLIGLGQDVGIEMVIEGIETELQHKSVVAEGALFGQGYLFGKPSPLTLAAPRLDLSERKWA